MAEAFVVYSEGLCMASVCSSLPFEEVCKRMSIRHTGLDWGWTPSTDKTFRDGGKPSDAGKPNPCPCDRYPETHTHYLFSC